MGKFNKMDSCEIKNNIVTYNAHIKGYEIQNKYVEVRNLFDDIKETHFS